MNRKMDLLQRRAELVAQARRDFLEPAVKDKRAQTAEEFAKYEAMMKEAEGLKATADNLDRQDVIESALDQPAALSHGISEIGGMGGASVEKRALAAFAAGGYEAVPKGTPERKALDDIQGRAFISWWRAGGDAGQLTPEFRAALNVTDLTRGGYLRPPMSVIQGILAVVDNLVYIRQLATKIETWEGGSAGQVSRETDIDDMEWSTELPPSITEDTSLKFGMRELVCNPFRKRIKVSKTLLNMPGYDILTYLNQRLGYKIGITQEKAYLLGTGVKQPLGLFVASNEGIPTSRDVVCGTTTAITFDGLRTCRGALKMQYRPRAKWLFHRDAVTQISLLRTNIGGAGTGEYMWQPAQSGQPDTIDGIPVFVSEYVPNTFTTGQYVGLFGDFSFYYILDGLNMQVQRLVELYAESNQDGLIANVSGDGMPVLSEAFVRCKLG
jgi:HK97 family phage major capsid protein